MKNKEKKEFDPLLSKRDDLLFWIEISIRYHAARLRWYENWHKRNLAFIILFSLIPILSIADTLSSLYILEYLQAFPSVALIIAAFDLVVDNSRHARLHERLSHRFSDIEVEIKSEIKLSKKKLADWDGKIHAISPDEPPMYRALNAHCENQTRQAQGDQKRATISWLQIFLMNVWHYNDKDFAINKEISSSPEGSSQ